jgi:hypothetical protein
MVRNRLPLSSLQGLQQTWLANSASSAHLQASVTEVLPQAEWPAIRFNPGLSGISKFLKSLNFSIFR